MKQQTEEYDLIIIGGGVSSSFLCLSILKLDPTFKIVVIEKNENFPQKIGESLVDLTALYVESLDIQHILKKHNKKTGVRFLFNESNAKDLSGISEFASPTLPGKINGYHLDRRLFDEDMLLEVISKGVKVYRPAEIVNASFQEFNNELEIKVDSELHLLKSKWLIDASGRVRYIPKLLNWKDKTISLDTGSIMAHFKNCVHDNSWDTITNAYWDTCSVGLRKYSTTHLMRKNCWWWIIRLDETTTSIGVVFDNKKIQFDDYQQYFTAQIENDAQLSILTQNAERGEVKHNEKLPYVCEKLNTKGIALLGDCGAFIDPLISPGMELIGQQTIWLAELLTKEKQTRKFNATAWKKYSDTFFKAYQSRLEIYTTAYDFMHSYDIFSVWLKNGNYVYFGWIVFPSVVFKSRLKYPLKLNWVERIGLNYFTARFQSILRRRITQNRISQIRKNEITYSSVRVPSNPLFLFVPLYLLIKSLWAYVKLEWKELKFLFKR